MTSKKRIQELEKKLAQAENQRDVLYGISLNLMKENGDLAMEREVAIHTFHSNGGGAIVRELNEIHDLLGADKKVWAVDAVKELMTELDSANKKLQELGFTGHAG